MSALVDLCDALEESVRPLPALASTLQQRSARLRSLAAEVQQARSRVRCTCGPDVGRVVQSLYDAADALASSAQALIGATQQSRSFIARTIAAGNAGALSDADRTALSDITWTGHQAINRSLSEGSLEDLAVVAERINAVSRALEKLPVHEGTVLRGSAGNLTESQIAEYEPGEVRVEDRFLHSSVDPNVADGSFHGNVVWVIDSKRGRRVESYSAVPSESEVMFDKFSRFEVLAKDQLEETGQWLIYMREV